MILSNASTSKGLRNFARFFTKTDTTTYSNADLDAAINSYYQLFVNEILESMDEWDFQGEIATANLVANQQEYSLPTDIIKIKRAEISYDGTNWYNLNFFDINERGKATDTTSITNDFSTSEPYADLMDTGIFLYPIPTAAVTGGLKIWYEKKVTELSSATDEPVLVEAYHIGLARGAAKVWLEQNIEIAGNKERLAIQSVELEKVIGEMRNFYNRRNQDRNYTIRPAYVNYDYGNN